MDVSLQVCNHYSYDNIIAGLVSVHQNGSGSFSVDLKTG